MVHISKTEVILLVYVQVLVAEVEQILSVVLFLFADEKNGLVWVSRYSFERIAIKLIAIKVAIEVTSSR